MEAIFKTVDPDALRLPVSPIPRPKEVVRWHAQSRPMTGSVLGHDVQGLAVVVDEFGLSHHRRFEDIRLIDPFTRRPPNWHDLPSGGRILQPDAETIMLFRTMMERRIPPGPSYQELVEEIWGRGFEVFLVGGTVRDVLGGAVANDIDLVTTMPLARIRGFAQEMFQTNEAGNGLRGYIRLGGKPSSGDPFIDLKVFSQTLQGTKSATFGVGFERDLGARDFTCNAVYYDSKNEAIIDPSGHGVADCYSRTLRLVPGPHDVLQRAQVFIRAVKFMTRGFVPIDETREVLLREYRPALAALKIEFRISYFITQVVSKHTKPSDKRDAVDRFKSVLSALGCSKDWAQFFGGVDERLT